jgi:hypothetical protein
MAEVTPPHGGSLTAFAGGDVSTVVGSTLATIDLGTFVQDVEASAERRRAARTSEDTSAPPSVSERLGRMPLPHLGCLR